jgi:hypothetical protein
MDDRMRDALNAILADNERFKRIVDAALADFLEPAGREDIRTILARIEALLIEHLEVVRDLRWSVVQPRTEKEPE